MPEERDYPALPRREPVAARERHTDPLPVIPPSTTVEPITQVIERIVEKPVDRIVEVEKIVERVIEKPVEKIVERIIEKPVREVVYVDRPADLQQATPPAPHITHETHIHIEPDRETEREVPEDRGKTEVEVEPEANLPTQPEVKKVEPKAKTEAIPVSTEVDKPTSPERKPEEKDSGSEEKSSTSGTKKLKVYNGLGRRHTAAQIDEILDWYILYGELPDYVTDRQRYAYKHHVKLPERRQLLEQAGHIKRGGVSSAKRGRKN